MVHENKISLQEEQRLSALELAGKAAKDKNDLIGILEKIYDILQDDCGILNNVIRTWIIYELNEIADKNDWEDSLRKKYLNNFKKDRVCTNL